MRDALSLMVTPIAEHGRCARGGEHVRCRGSKVHRPGIAAALIATVLVCAGRAAGQCSYEVQSLDYPIDCGIGSVITIPTGLNNHGAVVGRYWCSIWTTALGFLWTPEDGFSTLPLPPGANGLRADDINDAGAIVGSYALSAVVGVAFVYQDGRYTEILPPRGGSCNCIWASAIDNEGTVAGRFSIGNSSQTSAYVWRPETGVVDLGVMNGPYSTAGRIGPGGHVTGWTGSISNHQGFIYRDGELTIVPPIPGGVTSGAGGITADGLLVGSGLTALFPDPDLVIIGFLWRNGQFLHFIDPLPGYDHSGTGNINWARQVTGISGSIANPDDRRGYLWQHGVTHDLNDLVPPGSLLIQRAGAINEHGQILALSGGHAFLLTPVGRPLGDVDIDCGVGITDFLWVLREWGHPDSPADLNNDGNVDLLDLIIVIDNWGRDSS